ncbi:MAG: hypothetical protein E7176_05430 [Erysipelotrichaceae bacterium]|nr:hypothetical protein [Erysipelotrichaceae bacterium]
MKSFYKYLIPSVIATVFLSTYAIIDGMFIGQKIGDIGLSAINFAWPITSFLQSIGIALGLSGGIYISSLNGKDKIEEANRMKLTVIIIISIISIIMGITIYFFSRPLLSLFGAKGTTLDLGHRYIKIILIGSLFQMLGIGLTPLLKNSGKVKIAAAAGFTSIGINLILDYIFMYPMNLGLEGAALASVLAQFSSFIVCIIPYIKELKGVYFTKESMKKLFTGAIAPFVLNFSYSFIIILTNALCMNYGGDEAVAAYTLLSYLLYIIGAIGTGVADSIQPLFSYNHAQANYKDNYRMLRKCLLISFILCLLASLLFFFLRNPLEKLYNLSSLACEYYEKAIIYYLIGFIFVSLIKVICSYFYSINDKMRANIITLSEPIILTPLVYLILCLILNINGVWISFTIIQVLLLLIGIFLLYRRNKYDSIMQNDLI